MHNGNVSRLENVCYKVKGHLRNLMLVGHLGPEQWEGSYPKVDFMGVKLDKGMTKRVEKNEWSPPDLP